MSEKIIDAKRESTMLQEGFGENAEIIETAEGYSVKTVLESDELDGGQKVELTLGHRKVIPVGMEEYGLVLSGVPVLVIKINGKLLEGYNLYMSPFDQDGTQIVSLYFADVESKSIIMSSIKSATDLAALFHEIGHIEGNHNKGNRGSLVADVKDKVISKYFDQSKLTFDEQGFLNDKEAVAAVYAVYEQELEANERGAEALNDFSTDLFPSDPNYTKLKQYLRSEIIEQYLEIYGINQETLKE